MEEKAKFGDGVTPQPSNLVRFGPFGFDPANGLLTREGTELHLPPRTLAVLQRLLERRGEVVSKRELLDAGWKDLAVSEPS